MLAYLAATLNEISSSLSSLNSYERAPLKGFSEPLKLWAGADGPRFITWSIDIDTGVFKFFALKLSRAYPVSIDPSSCVLSRDKMSIKSMLDLPSVTVFKND